MLLHLVRHGRPLVDPLCPARHWQLDPAGVVEIQALRTALPPSAHHADWFSSDECKALSTARHLTGSAVEALPELGEAARTSYVEDQVEFADAVRRGLQAPAIAALPGWEPLDQARRRITAAVADILRRSSGDLVLVGHGTAWTLLTCDLLEEPLPERLPAMAMPDLLTLDLTSRTTVGGWGAWRTR